MVRDIILLVKVLGRRIGNLPNLLHPVDTAGKKSHHAAN